MSAGRLVAVLLLGAIACGPRVDPAAVGTEPTPSPRSRRRTSGPRPARNVVVGEMCPASAGGRPGVQPWFVRQLGWVDAPEDVTAPIERGLARQFAVLAFDGRRAGLFSVVGLARPEGAALAAGGYAGASPCARPASLGAATELDAACTRTQRECGVAIAEIVTAGVAPVGEDPEPIELDTGAACVAGDALMIDVDGDGRSERFPLAGFLDDDSGPADEVVAVSGGEVACEPRFSLAELLPERHPRGFLGLDLLAVVDSDGDGRRELVVQLRYAGRRTVALYAAPETGARLELAAEAVASP